MELSPNNDHKQVIKDVAEIVFRRFPVMTWDILNPQEVYRGKNIELTPTRERIRTADVMETRDALTITYREYTPRKRLRRASSAIRLPKESDDLRVTSEVRDELDYFEFVRGEQLGDKPTKDSLKHWHPILREVIERAANG